jgi:hypothetical protein
MKKDIIILVMCMFLMSFVFAVEVHKSGTGIENLKLMEAGQGLEDGANLMNRQKVMSGNYVGENGQQIKIQTQANNQIRLEVGGVGVDCDCNMTQEQVQNKTKLKTTLSNGKNSEIKVMPNTASETALQRLRLKVCNETNNCTIELKEVGQGEKSKLAYEMQIERHSRILGIFQKKMQVQTQVDAETGEFLKTKKPWWAFLASEPTEE